MPMNDVSCLIRWAIGADRRSPDTGRAVVRVTAIVVSFRESSDSAGIARFARAQLSAMLVATAGKRGSRPACQRAVSPDSTRRTNDR